LNYQEIYQKLYSTDPNYGRGSGCPATRELNSYIDYLESPVCDLGSGSGELVALLQKKGYSAVGFDYADCEDNIVCDITKPLPLHGFSSGVCFDVLEHIPEKDLNGVAANLIQVDLWAICINNTSSICNGIELHVTRWPYDKWHEWLKQFFTDLYAIRNTTNGGRLWIAANLSH